MLTLQVEVHRTDRNLQLLIFRKMSHAWMENILKHVSVIDQIKSLSMRDCDDVDDIHSLGNFLFNALGDRFTSLVNCSIKFDRFPRGFPIVSSSPSFSSLWLSMFIKYCPISSRKYTKSSNAIRLYTLLRPGRFNAFRICFQTCP